MVKAFEEIKEQLEGLRKYHLRLKEEAYFPVEETKELRLACCYQKAIDIVDQVAKKVAADVNVGCNGWIPCSKELPKVYEDTKSSDVVLVCGYDEESDYSWQAMGFYVHTEGIKRWFFAECKDTDKPIDWIDIVAWQPLPEPYKEELCRK